MNVNFNIIFNVSVLSGNFGIVELQNTLLLCLLFLGLIIFNKSQIFISNDYLLLSKRNNPWEDNLHVAKRARLDSDSSNGAENNSEPNSDNPEESENRENSPSVSVSSIHSVIPNEQQILYINQPLPILEDIGIFRQVDIHMFLHDNFFNIRYASIDNLNINQTISNITNLVDAYIQMEGEVRDLHLSNINNSVILDSLFERYGQEVYYLNFSPNETSSESSSNSGGGGISNHYDSDSSMPSTPPSNVNNYIIEKLVLFLLTLVNILLDLLAEICSNFTDFF